MGLLKKGKPLSWEESRTYSSFVRRHGLLQFISVWNRIKDIHDDKLRWGDEVECGIFKINREKKTVKLSLRAAAIRDSLAEAEINMDHLTDGCTWHPEYGAWMVESTPSRPYSNYVADLLHVEKNMRLRRSRLLSCLQADEIAPYVTCFPLMGVGEFIDPESPFEVPFSQSLYVPDVVINPHPRFGALTNNIRSRRGSKVDIRIPLFQDINTPDYATSASSDSSGEGPEESNPTIHMDCMSFGMGMCCLQVTFQARDLDESRYMYDQLAVLAPIMLALTAATPIFKGRLADIDARWTVIAQSVDDRTPAERGLVSSSTDLAAMAEASRDMVGSAVRRLHKSRYDSISTYIYHCAADTACRRSFEFYNDIPCPIDEEAKQLLRDEGVDENLAHHLAHLFVRDPLVIFEGAIDIDDSVHTDHFENIQSTNWQTVRWKPPPPRVTPNDPHIGWRTEFRSMELQLTDFENAAMTVFVVLITRVILAFDLSLYIPLSKVDENMRRAHLVDASRRETFIFRKFMAPPEDGLSSLDERDEKECDDVNDAATTAAAAARMAEVMSSASKWPGADDKNAFEEMTLDEIFNGKCCYFPGLLPLVYAYLDYVKCDNEIFSKVDQYLKFISMKATGQLMSTASWMRKFVVEHPDYKHDSVVSDVIAYDLMIACKEIGEGERQCPELLGHFNIQRVRPEDGYGQLLSGRTNSAEERADLIKYFLQRAHARSPNQRVRGLSLSDLSSSV